MLRPNRLRPRHAYGAPATGVADNEPGFALTVTAQELVQPGDQDRYNARMAEEAAATAGPSQGSSLLWIGALAILLALTRR